MDSELLHRFSETVQSIHSAALQPHLWPQALAHIAALHNAPTALAFTPLTHPDEGGFVIALAIAQSAQQIQKAVHEMKEVTIAARLPDITPNKKAQMDAMEMSVPPGLGSRISLSFDGNFTTLVEGIAKSTGWSYIEEGNRPPVIQVVHKEYKQVRAVVALRDIGYSLQGSTVILDSINRRVIVRF